MYNHLFFLSLKYYIIMRNLHNKQWKRVFVKAFKKFSKKIIKFIFLDHFFKNKFWFCNCISESIWDCQEDIMNKIKAKNVRIDESVYNYQKHSNNYVLLKSYWWYMWFCLKKIWLRHKETSTVTSWSKVEDDRRNTIIHELMFFTLWIIQFMISYFDKIVLVCMKQVKFFFYNNVLVYIKQL